MLQSLTESGIILNEDGEEKVNIGERIKKAGEEFLKKIKDMFEKAIGWVKEKFKQVKEKITNFITEKIDGSIEKYLSKINFTKDDLEMVNAYIKDNNLKVLLPVGNFTAINLNANMTVGLYNLLKKRKI